MRRRNIALALEWGLVSLAVIITVAFVIQLSRYSAQRSRLPLGMTIGGLDVSGLTPEQATERVMVAFAAPVDLLYQDEHIALQPAEIGFRLDRETLLAAVEMTREATDWWQGFRDYLSGQPATPRALQPELSYSREQLMAVLQRIAQSYDRGPQAPQVEADTLRFLPGEPGRQLDIPASLPRVEAALRSALNRRAELVVRESPLPDASLEALRPWLERRLSGFDGVVGLYVLDLDTGRELAYNGDVAFSGLGVLRLPILVAAYAQLEAPFDPATRQLISEALASDNNGVAAANALLALIGNGDSLAGAGQVTALMKSLGLVNTFIALPYDATPEQPVNITTPANSLAEVNTDADPARQTTPADSGQLLQMIYQCARNGGALLAALPGRLTPAECRELLEALSAVRSGNLLETGLPPEARLAHRPAWSTDTHADAGVIFSPGGDYVVAVFVWRPEYLDWALSAPLIADLNKAVYNYFNR